MNVDWGKPRIFTKDIDDAEAKWVEQSTPVEDTTELSTEQGDKVEAPIEGGENEDVRIKRSKYSFNYNIRKVKGRKKPFPSNDGVVDHHYAVMLQPEDPTCKGFSIEKSTVAVLDSYTAADGAMWQITHEVLKAETGNAVKWGIVTVDDDGQPTFVEDTE